MIKIPFNIPKYLTNHNIIDNYNTDIESVKDWIDKSIHKLDKLPNNLMISTITTTGKINCKMILENISKYIVLSNEGILSIKYGGKIKKIKKKKIKSKRKKTTRCFENQLSIEMRVINDRKINIKIFKNGSFQMTGCKSLDDCNLVLNKLIDILNTNVATVEDNLIVNKPFYEELEGSEMKVISFRIDMINSNYNVNYYINRNSLYEILQTQKVICRHEPCVHPCVNIKFLIEDENKIVSIFVFQSGNIIITGAKNQDQICKAYYYISDILDKNYSTIVKKDIMNLLDSNDIKEILEELEIYDDDDVNELSEDNIIV